MSVAELVKAAEVVVDAEGRKKAVLDWSVWEQVVAALEQFDAWAAEFAAWDALSDEALLNFDAELTPYGAG